MAEPIAGEAFINPLLYAQDVDWLKNGQMQTGEVLVAGITTPAWTPLFAVAPAVVADVGESFSYGSIVAREYGIPAVLVSQEIEFAVDGISTEGWQVWH